MTYAAVAATLAVVALLLTIERRIKTRREAARAAGVAAAEDEHSAGIQRGFDAGWHGQSRWAA